MRRRLEQSWIILEPMRPDIAVDDHLIGFDGPAGADSPMPSLGITWLTVG